MSKIYAIGDRENGILFIKTDPRRVIHIPRDQIESYAREAGCSVEQVFDDLAGVLAADGGSRFASIAEIGDAGWDVSRFFTMPAGGTDPEICAVSELGHDGWDISRFFTMPAGGAAPGIRAVSEIGHEGWDVSRFFTMPAGGEAAGIGAVAEIGDGAWDVSRFVTMPAGRAPDRGRDEANQAH
jgi:hypothetical protein